jgi:phosphate transport system substrate-binding protein
METNGLAFFRVVAIITNLSTVFRGRKYIFFEMKKNVSLQPNMKKTFFIAFLLFCLISCEKDNIHSITMDNYPCVDGSTSTDPLNYIIACKLLKLEYEWIERGSGYFVIFKNFGFLPYSFTSKFRCSQTHEAITNLISYHDYYYDRNAPELIIVARKMSADEKNYAQEKGVSLIETPIALDALDFIVNSQNIVNSLTVKQIQDIYLGNITNWKEVGGADEAIMPFIRNANSGSQEMMNEIVMKNAGMPDWQVSYADELTIYSMMMVYEELQQHPNAICFTPHYYKEYMIRDFWGIDFLKTLAINEVMPDKKSIKKQTYPFVAPVYVSIRSDLDKNSMAYKLYQWLQTNSGKSVIEESGYVPK